MCLSGDGTFTKQLGTVFGKQGETFAFEDPFVWTQNSRYYAIVEDMRGVFTGAGTSLALFESPDGMEWHVSPNALVSRLELAWDTGITQAVERLERPQLFFENGKPAVLTCAVRELGGDTFIVAIPVTTQP